MQLGELKVKEVMTTCVFSVKKTMPVTALVDSICNFKLHTVPVVDDDDNLIGIVGIRDILKVFMTKYISTVSELLDKKQGETADGADISFSDIDGELLIGDIMKRNIKFVDEEASVVDVAFTMFSRSIHRLPVVQGKKLVGIVSQSDIMNAMSKALL